jgi:hypothetical protein
VGAFVRRQKGVAKTALANSKDFPGPANLSRKSVDLNSKGMYT